MNLKSRLGKLDALKEKVTQGINNIPSLYAEKLDVLREKVSEEIMNLHQTVSEGENRFQDMESGWNGMVNVIETTFVSSYNRAHPERKIDMEVIRNADIAAEFPATKADRDAIADAKQRIQEYKTSEQRVFYNAISSANSKIAGMQGEYRQGTDVLMHAV